MVSTVDALRRSLSAVSFGFGASSLGLSTRFRVGFVSVASMLFRSSRWLMSRPRLECVTRTFLSEIFSRESRAGRCSRLSMRAANFATGSFV